MTIYRVTFEIRTSSPLPLISKANKEIQVRWYQQFFTPVRKAIEHQYGAFVTSVQIANYSIEEVQP